ncbi:MAG TPA: carboxypeptidase-like regulatory domain-containing protein [Chitinophagaceae bacterium]|nr:carboxypeptidase-like regulatory domain-containing protein [Chitinophagaceae bacterium]
MKQPLKLHIPEPCHEQWAEMTPQDQGRFCGSCQKIVVDFTAMTDRQIIEYFANYNGSTCGRFSNDQLDRNIAAGVQKPRHWFKYMLNAMIPALLIANKSYSQGEPIIKKDTTVCTDKGQSLKVGRVAMPTPLKTIVTGKVTDRGGNPFPGASVVIKGSTRGTTTDAAGNFRLTVNAEAPVTLTVSAVGVMQQEVVVDHLKPDTKVVLVEMEPAWLGEVIVTGKPSKPKKTVFHQFKKFVADSLKKQAFSVYPNPAKAGAAIKINYPLKANYTLQLYNASGQPVQRTSGSLSSGLFQLNNDILPGQYTVVLLDNKKKKLGTQILIVQ